jgi:hypothetical protein
MDIRLNWLDPFDLDDDRGLIYAVPDEGELPTGPGIYVFARVHGKTVTPMYIGLALNLRKRILQQLKTNVRLMRGLENAPAGYRTCHVGVLVRKPAQNALRVLRIAEAALINTALVEGFKLINIQGTKTLVHTVANTGNRESRRWIPDSDIGLRSSTK